MMSNAWRDPVWRAAFLALARGTSLNGECDTPEPPDGTHKATHNPFANHGECSSTFDLGTGKYTVSRQGSLLDFFCSRCHMPTDYVDNIPLKNVKVDAKTHIESAVGDPHFNPTSDNGTGIAFATLEPQYRNTESGKSGVICAVCHTYVETRDTPTKRAPASTHLLPEERPDLNCLPRTNKTGSRWRTKPKPTWDTASAPGPIVYRHTRLGFPSALVRSQPTIRPAPQTLIPARSLAKTFLTSTWIRQNTRDTTRQ